MTALHILISITKTSVTLWYINELWFKSHFFVWEHNIIFRFGAIFNRKLLVSARGVWKTTSCGMLSATQNQSHMLNMYGILTYKKLGHLLVGGDWNIF